MTTSPWPFRSAAMFPRNRRQESGNQPPSDRAAGHAKKRQHRAAEADDAFIAEPANAHTELGFRHGCTEWTSDRNPGEVWTVRRQSARRLTLLERELPMAAPDAMVAEIVAVESEHFAHPRHHLPRSWGT